MSSSASHPPKHNNSSPDHVPVNSVIIRSQTPTSVIHLIECLQSLNLCPIHGSSCLPTFPYLLLGDYYLIVVLVVSPINLHSELVPLQHTHTHTIAYDKPCFVALVLIVSPSSSSASTQPNVLGSLSTSHESVHGRAKRNRNLRANFHL